MVSRVREFAKRCLPRYPIKVTSVITEVLPRAYKSLGMNLLDRYPEYDGVACEE